MSDELLSPSAQVVPHGAGAFLGGFTLKALEAVTLPVAGGRSRSRPGCQHATLVLWATASALGRPLTRSDRHRPLHRAVHELVRLPRLTCRDDAIVVRREPADRIGGRRVACEPHRLAAAPAPIGLLGSERAGAARLLHPVGPAKARERVGLGPDPLQRMLTDVGELKSRN